MYIPKMVSADVKTIVKRRRPSANPPRGGRSSDGTRPCLDTNNMTQAAIKTNVKKYQSTLASNRVDNKNGRPEMNMTTPAMNTRTRRFSDQGDTAWANNGRLSSDAMIKKAIPAILGSGPSVKVKNSKPVKNDRAIRKIVLTPTGYFFFIFVFTPAVHFTSATWTAYFSDRYARFSVS